MRVAGVSLVLFLFVSSMRVAGVSLVLLSCFSNACGGRESGTVFLCQQCVWRTLVCYCFVCFINGCGRRESGTVFLFQQCVRRA